MEFLTFDYISVTVIAVLGGIGLWRGIAGELAGVAWIATALVVGFFAYAQISNIVASAAAGRSFDSPDGIKYAAVGATVLVALLAALVVRFAVRKFVSFLLPQPWNAILGGIVGVLKGAVLVAVVSAVGLVKTGPLAEGFFASRSVVVKYLEQAADSYKAAALKALTAEVSE